MGRALVLVLVLAGCPARKTQDTPKPEDPRKPAVAVPLPVAPPFEIAAPSDAIVAIGRGFRHACAVRASGAVDCWGQHLVCKDHQNCLVLPAADATIRRAAGVTDAVAIAADAKCVVRKTGEVACLSEDKLEFVPLPGLKDIERAGDTSNCFIAKGGALWCVDGENKPWAVPNVKDAIAVSSSISLACAVRRNGQIACGEVSGGSFKTMNGVPKATQVAIGGDWNLRMCLVATTGDASCYDIPAYIDEDAPLKPRTGDDWNGTALPQPERFKNASHIALRVHGWGDFFHLTLEAVVNGRVLASDLRESVDEVPLLSDVAQHVHSCAVRKQGSLVCWGSNIGGSLAQPTTIGRIDAPPALVAGAGDIVDLALGTRWAYALTRDGRVLAWGDDRAYALPQPLGAGPQDIVEIAADREDRACFRSKKGEVWCYFETERLNDRRIDQLDTEDVASMSMGKGHAYVVRRDGTAEAHAVGMMYVESTSEALHLEAPVIGSGGAWDFRCWMYRDHTIGCPKRIDGFKQPTAMAAGHEFACAIENGSVRCHTFRYEEGWPKSNDKLFDVADIRDATDIAASLEYACAVHSGGRVACFHFDKQGVPTKPVEVLDGGAVDVELGHGTGDQIARSRALHGPRPAGETGCAITRDYTVKCWGTNLVGETGDGSLIQSESPIGVKL